MGSIQIPGLDSTIYSSVAIVLTLLYRELMKNPIQLREGLRELVRYMKEEETEITLMFVKRLSERTRKSNEESNEEDYAKKLSDVRPVIEQFSEAMHLSGWIEAVTNSLPPYRGFVVRIAFVALLSLIAIVSLVNGILNFNSVLIVIGLLSFSYLAVMFYEAYKCNETAENICNVLYRRADALKYNFEGDIERVRSYATFCLRNGGFSQDVERSRGSRSSR